MAVMLKRWKPCEWCASWCATKLGVRFPNWALTNTQWGQQPNWVLTLMVPKRALANARLGVNFVPDMAPEPVFIHTLQCEIRDWIILKNHNDSVYTFGELRNTILARTLVLAWCFRVKNDWRIKLLKFFHHSCVTSISDIPSFSRLQHAFLAKKKLMAIGWNTSYIQKEKIADQNHSNLDNFD